MRSRVIARTLPAGDSAARDLYRRRGPHDPRRQAPRARRPGRRSLPVGLRLADRRRRRPPGLHRRAQGVRALGRPSCSAAQGRRFVAPVGYVWEDALQGFTVCAHRAAGRVAGRTSRTSSRVEPDSSMVASTTQSNATWGLDRIDQRVAPARAARTRTSTTGAGVTAYVIDTGHPLRRTREFGGRAVSGYDAVDGGCGRRLQRPRHARRRHDRRLDVRRREGRPRSSRVRVLDCSGSGHDLGRHRRHRLGDREPHGRTAGGGEHEPRRRRVERARHGRARTRSPPASRYAVAAGNGNRRRQDACKPRRRGCRGDDDRRDDAAPTRARRSRTSARASTCSRPGVGITSAWSHERTPRRTTISGTSMATPHVGGRRRALPPGQPGPRRRRACATRSSRRRRRTSSRARGAAARTRSSSPATRTCANRGRTADPALGSHLYDVAI